MNVDEAKAAVLSLLTEKGRATNSEILEMCGSDERLRQRVTEELIIDDLAEDKKGVGLVSVAASATDQAAVPAPVSPVGAAAAAVAAPAPAAKDVFISYSHKNWREADQIESALGALGLSVFIDRTKLGAGRWAVDLSDAIQACTAFAILCSEHSLASDDVLNECALANHFKRHRVPLHLRRPPLDYPSGFNYFLQAWNAAVIAGRPPHEWLEEVVGLLEKARDHNVRLLGSRARAALVALPRPPAPAPSPRPARVSQGPPAPGAPPWRRVFRVYLSSTFADLAAERNALQEVVFPRLRDLVESYGARFQPVDFRWGVSEEDALDQRTMRIVHEEIERCQRESPYLNFISLIGDRYGWRPLPEVIVADEFEAIRAAVPPPEASLLDDWYRRDDNAVPPMYELEPRVRQWIDWNEWAPVEAALRSIFESALESIDLERSTRQKYESSALEQELVRGVFEVPDAHEHVLCFMREIEGLPDDRRALPFADVGQDGSLDREGARRLAKLKDELRASLGDNVRTYRATWQDGEVTHGHLNALCEDAYESLSRVMLDALAREEEVDALEREVEEQLAFAASRAQTLVGTEVIAAIAALGEYLHSGASRPLVVVGEPGSGVSTVMAGASLRAGSEGTSDAVVRFVGSTPQSADGIALLRGLCGEIARRQGRDEAAVPDDYLGLAAFFREALATATGETPLLVFIDGLDSIQGPPRDLRWLPGEVASSADVVVSVEPGPLLEVLERVLPADCFLRVEPFSVASADELLRTWLVGVGRTLQPHQRQAVLDAFEASGGSPLYLRLAFEEARRWRSFSSPETTQLASGVPALMRDLFQRLSQDHGEALVAGTLAFLAAGRFGLSEAEILDLLSRDAAVLEDQRRRSPGAPVFDRLPLAPWLRLRADLDPYLAERVSEGTLVLGFVHRWVAEVAADAYLSGDEVAYRHAALADYFRALADPTGDRTWSGHARALSELPYHLIAAEREDAVFEVLTDFVFLERKAASVGVVDVPDGDGGAVRRYTGIDHVAEDLERSLEGLLRDHAATTAGALLASVRRESHVLRRWPELLWQQLSNDLQFEEAAAEPLASERQRRIGRQSWLRTRPLRPRALVRTLAGHQGPVRGCAVSSDGSVIVSASNDSTVKLWDATTGQEGATFMGHRGWVSGCAVDGWGTLLVTSSEDRTLRLWDLAPTRRRERVLSGHDDEVTACALNADATVAVSASRDGALKLWDIEAGLERLTLRGHLAPVTACDISSDGGLVLSADAEDTLRLWDGKTGAELATFSPGGGLERPGPSSSAELQGGGRRACCVISPDGHLVVSGHADGSVRLWDLTTQALLATLTGHGGPVNDCAVSPDASFVASASADRTIRIWDLTTGEHLGVLADPGGPVESCAVSPDGRHVVSGAHDGTLNVWDVGRVGQEQYRTRHEGAVLDCAFTSDGSLVITSGEDETVRLSDVETGYERATLRADAGAVFGCVALGESRFVSTGSDGTLSLWDVAVMDRKAVVGAHEGRVLGVDARGRFLVSCGEDGTARLWGVSAQGSLAPIWRRGDGQLQATACAVSQHGSCAAGSADGRLQIWDVDGELRIQLSGHTSSVTSCAFAPDESAIVSTSWDRTVRIWDARSGEERARFEAHDDRVWDCAVSPDGLIVASAGGDGAVRLWDLAGRTLGLLPLPAEALTIAFHPSRPLLACGDSGGTVRVIDLANVTR